MVRETRHLWVGNLPENIREDRILEHFKRYGKVQSVKILPRKDDDPSGGVSATVAFIDIKSAAKAHNGEHKIEERTLKTDYYEPPASSTASSAIYIHERDDSLARPSAPAYTGTRPSRYPHGVPEERNYERSGHYYERLVDREAYLRRPMGYHDDDGYQSRGRPRDRNQSHFRAHGTRQHFDVQRYPCADQYAEDREAVAPAGRLVRRPNSTASGVSSTVSSPPQQRTTGHHKKQKRKSPSHSHSGSRSNSPSRSRSSSRSTAVSRSSSSSSKLRSSSSDSSSRSRSPSKSRSPAASYGSQGSRKGGRSDRPASTIAAPPTSGSYLPSTVATPATNSVSACSQGSSQSQSGCSASSDNCNEKEDKRPRAICVRNLPVRSTDTSLKDGLFHEYKKHGKVTMVKVIGQGTDRYAVVCFKKPDDVEKALEVSRDKLFFGCKIEVTAHEGLDGEDNEFRPLEAELDEYHPKATRTLFIGNLEKDITTSELRRHFEPFGDIIEIDIKKQATASSYAFIQYSDIASVVKAMRKLDGENLGANRIKLGFGKSMPTNCVWMDGIVDTVTEKMLLWHFHRFGPVSHIVIDRGKGHALVFYDSLEFAQIAVSEMRGRSVGGKRLQVDFASRECQSSFFEKMETSGQLMPGERPWERRERRAEFEVIRDERDTRTGFDSYTRNYTRYDGQQRAARGAFRGVQRTSFNNRGRGQAFTGRFPSREEGMEDGSGYEDKPDRTKPLEINEKLGKKKGKHRNSISDQESHHSQSPPHSRHQSRSRSPPVKEKRVGKERERPHGRTRSPENHSSPHLGSPVRDMTIDFEAVTDKEGMVDTKECGVRRKSSISKQEAKDSSIASLCPKPEPFQETCEKSRVRGSVEVLKRRLQDCDLSECSPLAEMSSPTERKRRLLEASDHLVTSKDIMLAQLRTESDNHGRLKNSLIPNLISARSELTSVDGGVNEDGKSDTESGELLEEVNVEKPRAESANSDLKTLEKEHVHILSLLEQLGEGATSSDTEGSGELDEPSKKRAKSLRWQVSLSHGVVKGFHAAISSKNECQDSAVFSSKVSELDDGVEMCVIPRTVDSMLSGRKPVDPRKSLEQVNAGTVGSHSRFKRLLSDKEIVRLTNERTETSDQLLSSPTGVSIPLRSKTSFGSVHRVAIMDSETGPCIDEVGTPNLVREDHNVEEHLTSESATHRKLSRSSLSSLEVSRQSSVNLRVSSGASSESKKDKEMGPLSLPLPGFAASLRSPKVVLNPPLSPKANSLSPRGGHSPSSGLSSKSPYHTSDNGKVDKIAVHSGETKTSSVGCAASQSLDSKSSPSVPPTSSSPLLSPKSPKKSNDAESSSDSESSALSSPNCQSIEERIRALDEKFNAWSGSTRCVNASLTNDVPPTPTIRPRFLPARTEPSDIVKSLLAKSSIFDQDSKRLEHINEKYEPKEVNIDLSPKAKPFFRTKAAAKEFATPIPSLTSLNHTPANRFSMFYSVTTASTTSPSTSLQTSTPAVPSHLSSVSLPSQSPAHYSLSQSSSTLSSSSPTCITSTSKQAPDLISFSQQKQSIIQPAFNATVRKSSSDLSKPSQCGKKEPTVTCSSVSSTKTSSLSGTSSSFHNQAGGGSTVVAPPMTLKKESIPLIKESLGSQCAKKENRDNSKDPVLRKDSVPSTNTLKDIPQKKDNPSLSFSKNQSSKKDNNTKEILQNKEIPMTKELKRESSHSSSSKEQVVVKKELSLSSSSSNGSKEKREQLPPSVPSSKESKHDNGQLAVKDQLAASKKEPNAANQNSAIKELSKRESSGEGMTVLPTTKRRIPSIDSESDSGKSSDIRTDIRESQWQTTEIKSEPKNSSDIDFKKNKNAQGNNSSRESEKSKEKASSPQPHNSKKTDKKDKSSRSSEKSRSSLSRSESKMSLDRRDDQDSRSSEGKISSEQKEKSRSESSKLKDDKKQKSKDNSKGNGKNEWKNRSKSTDSSRSSEKADKKSAHSSNKNKRDHNTEKSEKQIERKQQANETTKHDSSSSKPRRRRSEAKLSFSEEEPVYFSMYDKVKARSSQNQSLKEAKDLESVRQKFSQLKRSRAKREEKSKSHEMDTDEDSDSASHMSEDKDTALPKARAPSKTKQNKKRKLVIESSSDNEESCHPTSLGDFQCKEERVEMSSDAGFDSDVGSHPEPSILRLMSPNYSASKSNSKSKELLDDSASSDGISQLVSPVSKRAKASASIISVETKPNCIRSDDSSDNEAVIRVPKKKKDGGKRKLKKEKYVERMLDSDASDAEPTYRKNEDHKGKKSSSSKEEKHTPEANYSDIFQHASSSKERKPSGSGSSKNLSSSKNDTDNNETESKPKTPGKKKKKSKKSKGKDRKPPSEKSDVPKVQNIESKVPSPKLISSPPKDVPPPPSLSAHSLIGVLSDNEFKSDFSDLDVDNEKSVLVESEQDPLNWMCADNKPVLDMETKMLESMKSEGPEVSPNSNANHESVESECSGNIIKHSGLDNKSKEAANILHAISASASDSSSAELEKAQDGLENAEVEENTPVESAPKKHHQSHKKSSSTSEDGKKELSKSKSKGDDDHTKEEKHKKKNKKQSKEKKKKAREEHYKVDDLPPALQEILEPSYHERMPPPLDEESRMSEDIRLDEDIAEQARRLEEELLAATEETSTFGDSEGPCRREEKLQERRFEEEAAKETRRLEEELLSTAREPWHMKEAKPFDDDGIDDPAPSLDDHSEKEQKMTQEAVETLTFKENALFCNLDGSSSVGMSVADHDVTQDFLVGQDGEDQFKLEEKDAGSYEVDNQRKIEDDLAVSALLQEMNCDEMSAPDLTKETDYLGPLLEPSADEAMSYLNMLPVDGTGTLQMNESPNHITDIPQEEQNEEKTPPPLLELPEPIVTSEHESPHHLISPEPLKEVSDSLSECPQILVNEQATHLPEEDLLPSSPPEADEEPPLVSCERLIQPPELSQPISPGNPPVLEMEMSVMKNKSRRHRKKPKRDKTPKPESKDIEHLKSYDMKIFTDMMSLSDLNMYTDIKDFHTIKSPPKKTECPDVMSYPELDHIPNIKIEHSEDDSLMKINELPQIKDIVIDSSPPPAEKDLEKFESVLHSIEMQAEACEPELQEKEPEEIDPPVDGDKEYLCDSVKFSVIKSTLEEQSITEATPTPEGEPLKSDKDDKDEESQCDMVQLPHVSDSNDEACDNFRIPVPSIFPENESEQDSNPPTIPEYLNEPKGMTEGLPTLQLEESPFPLERMAEPSDLSESHRLLESDCPALLSDSLCSEERKDNGSDHTEDSDKTEIVDDSEYQPGVGDLVEDGEKEEMLSFEEDAREAEVDIEREIVSVENIPPPAQVEDEETRPNLTEDSQQHQHEHEDDNADEDTQKQHFQLQQQQGEEETNPALENKAPIIPSEAEDEGAPALEPDEKKKHERPRRGGRRGKARRSTEASTTHPKNEGETTDAAPTLTQLRSSKQSSKQRSSSSVLEKAKRNLRSQILDISIPLEPVDLAAHIDSVQSCETSSNVDDSMVNEDQELSLQAVHELPKNPSNDSSAVDEDSTKETGEDTKMKSDDLHQVTESALETTDQVKQEEPRKRRGGRKKKGSSDSHAGVDKTDNKRDEGDSKDTHRQREPRLLLSLSSSEKGVEQKSTRGNADVYDVFEFRDSDEDLAFEREMPSTVRHIDAPRSSGHGHDHRHHESKHCESLHEREKRHDDSKHKSSHHDDRDISGKEYVTELSQHGKISITIRLHQKDSHDGSSSSTAEVVKTSEAVLGEDVKADSSRCEKSAGKCDNDSAGSNPVKATRKSARLMSQAPKTTVDEVIEDVVKGNFKDNLDTSADSVPVRPTRRTRANRRSEEAIARQREESAAELPFGGTETGQKAKNDTPLSSNDSKSKDQLSEKGSTVSSPITAPASSEASTGSGDTETKGESKPSLRTFRLTRSAARNEASRDACAGSSVSLSAASDQITEKNNEAAGSMHGAATSRKEHDSLKSPPHGLAEECLTQHHPENNQSRVLKVELPRMSVSVLSQVHSINMSESVKTRESKGTSSTKHSENDDECDSRSSPTMLIDPVTGVLAPIAKKEAAATSEKRSSSASTPPTIEQTKEASAHENAETPAEATPTTKSLVAAEPCSSPTPVITTAAAGPPAETDTTHKISSTCISESPETSTDHTSHTPLHSPGSQVVIPPSTAPLTMATEATSVVVSSTADQCLTVTSSATSQAVSSATTTVVVSAPILDLHASPGATTQDRESPSFVYPITTSEKSKPTSCIQPTVTSVVHSVPNPPIVSAGKSVTTAASTLSSSTTVTAVVTPSHVASPPAIPRSISPVGQPPVSLCASGQGWPHTTQPPSSQLAAFHPYVPPSVRSIPSSSPSLKVNKPFPSTTLHSSPVIQQSIAKTVAPTVVVSSTYGSGIPSTEVNPKRVPIPHTSVQCVPSVSSISLTVTKSEVALPECLTSVGAQQSRSSSIVTSAKVDTTQVHSGSVPLPLIPPAHSRSESTSPRMATSQGSLTQNARTSPAAASRHHSTVISTQAGVQSHAGSAAMSLTQSSAIGKNEISPQVSQSGSGGSSKQSHPQLSKHSPNFMPTFSPGAYEVAVHSASQGLTPPTSTSSGVIAELLQNPHLLQQHKDYFVAQHSVSSGNQFPERMPTQMVRPTLTSALHADMATRLGNPTPPHTPTPPVTSTTHSLQPPELHTTHPTHLAPGLLRHPAQPTLIVPPHPPLAIHPADLSAYVRQQMLYAATHPHYAALHPELRAQQEAQARAAAAMAIPPRFPYPHIPPTTSPSGGFRHPLEPVAHAGSTDPKLEDRKSHSLESSKSSIDHRVLEERSSQQTKTSKIKQEIEKDVKPAHSEMRMTEDIEGKRLQNVVESRRPTNRHVPSPSGGVRPPGLAYPTPIRQLGPHISLSPQERLTDSPSIAHPYAQGQMRMSASQVPSRPEEMKQEPIPRPKQVKSESTERDVKPPAAHKHPTTTMAFRSLDPVGLNHPLLAVPHVGSPAPGYLEGHPVHQPTLALRKEAAPSPVLVPPLHQSGMPSESSSSHEVHKKVSHGRLLQQQKEPSLSPGPVALSTSHSPSPISNLVVSRASQQSLASMNQATGESDIRRASIHPIPQTGSEAPVHPPPPAHAMSQPGAPPGHPQTPPHASQVPPQGDSLLLQRYPVMWQGLLALKNDQAAVQMHFVSGNLRIAGASLPPVTDGGTPPVRIAQRMRLEQTQLEGVARKMQMVDEHCILLALPCGRDHMDVLQQSNNLRNGFINYLQSKQAAGIVNAAAPGSQQAAYVIHIFPSCDFSNENMARIAPDLLHSINDIAHLLIIIATV